jgi:hypothetical protein
MLKRSAGKVQAKVGRVLYSLMTTILLVAVGLNKFFFFTYFPSLGYQLAD